MRLSQLLFDFALEHGSSTFAWERGISVIVGWFAGRT
jgi:hypothetical protein